MVGVVGSGDWSAVTSVVVFVVDGPCLVRVGIVNGPN